MGQQPSVVACLGSSSTAGKGQAFNWVSELQGRLKERFVFRNFGVGGDLAYNGLQRLPAVIASNPQKIVVFIGGNDVLAMISAKARMYYRISKSLKRDPSPEWFEENIREIVRRAKAATSAAIGLCSLPPIGEDPTSSDSFQNQINQRIAQLNVVIRETARRESASYIAVHEAIQSQIAQSPAKSLTEFRFWPFYYDAFRTLVLGMSPDDVSRIHGWRFHTDGVHLNSRSGLIVADLVQQFIQPLA